MKYIYQLTILAAFVLLFAGCEDTNEIQVGSRDIAVVPGMSEAVPAFFTEDLANSFVAFSLELEEGDKVDDAEILVTFKDKTTVFGKIESFPTNITITAPEVIAKLGIKESDVKLGDNFLIEVLTTVNGVKTRSVSSLLVGVTCEFDPELSGGVYKAVSAGWEVAGDVTITVDPDDPYTLYIDGLAELDGVAGNGNKVKIQINKNSFKMTGEPAKVAANLGSYTGLTYTPTGGMFSSCDGEINMTFAITVDQGSFGSFSFRFTKN